MRVGYILSSRSIWAIRDSENKQVLFIFHQVVAYATQEGHTQTFDLELEPWLTEGIELFLATENGLTFCVYVACVHVGCVHMCVPYYVM